MRVLTAMGVVGAMVVAAAAHAVPVAPLPVTVQQPDGSKLVLFPVGDEYNLFLETTQGRTVVCDEEGWWRLATVDAEGRLVPGTTLAGSGPSLVRGLAAASLHLRPTRHGTGRGELHPVPPFARSSGVRALQVGTKEQPILVILVEFTDRAPVGASAADFQQAFFGSGESVEQYYRQATFGKLEVVPATDTHGADDGVVGWIKLPMAHPNRALENSTDPSVTEKQKTEASYNCRLAIKAAIEAADPYVDFARYDVDHNGYLSRDELAVVVIMAGWEASYGGYKKTFSPANWGHRWSLGFSADGHMVAAPVVDGVRVADVAGDGGYSTFGEWMQTMAGNGHRSTIGVMVHELGHDVLGLPDLYDTDGSSQGVGGWGLMGGGSWGSDGSGDIGSTPVLLSAWSRLATGISRPVELAGAGTVTAAPVYETGELFRLGSGDEDEFFLLEYRAPGGFDGGLRRWDYHFGDGGGIAVWHVDERQEDNADDAHRKVDLEEANGVATLDSASGTAAARTMLFFEGNDSPGYGGRLADDTMPSSVRYDGSASGVVVSDVGAATSSGIDFSYQAPNESGYHGDDCVSATQVSLAPGQQQTVSESLTQATGWDTPALCAPISGTGWFAITPSRTGRLGVETSGFDTVAAMLSGGCSSPSVLACNDDIVTGSVTGSRITGVSVRRGEEVHVVVGRWGSGDGGASPLTAVFSLAAADALAVSITGASGCPAMTLAATVSTATAPATGLGPADFTVVVGGASIRPSAVDEVSAGVYTLTVDLPAKASGALRLEVDTATASGDGETGFTCGRGVRHQVRPR